jgi:hypothetical protein
LKLLRGMGGGDENMSLNLLAWLSKVVRKPVQTVHKFFSTSVYVSFFEATIVRLCVDKLICKLQHNRRLTEQIITERAESVCA